MGKYQGGGVTCIADDKTSQCRAHRVGEREIKCEG